MRTKKLYQGIFKPKNPSKYTGDVNNIIYRSGWEHKFMQYLDSHQDILEWSSEELAIPYLSPVDNRYHRYFPDFIVKKRNKEGLIETLIIEIKPKSQTKEPAVKNKITKQYLHEVFQWGTNQAKWKACEQYCTKRGFRFCILTEHELGIK
mgnify:FL=1|jgi:hypothetical protein